MVDVVCAVSAARAVQTEATVNVADTQVSPGAGAVLRFQIGNSLTSVFSDFPAAFKRNSRKASFAIDGRFANSEAGCEFHQLDNVSEARASASSSL